MGRLKEPDVYSGFVISTIGIYRGKRIPMIYKDAQAAVASGTARWEDDETPMPKNLALEIKAAEDKRQAEIEADAEHAKKHKAGEGESIIDMLRAAAMPIDLAYEGEGDDAVYLASPLPEVTLIDKVHAYEGFPLNVEGQNVELTVANATAFYKIEWEDDTHYLCTLGESEVPDVEIPEDWRERNHLANIAAAKKIGALTARPSSTRMRRKASSRSGWSRMIRYEKMPATSTMAERIGASTASGSRTATTSPEPKKKPKKGRGKRPKNSSTKTTRPGHDEKAMRSPADRMARGYQKR